MTSLIQFDKSQTAKASEWLVQTIAELAIIKDAEHLIDNLSVVLAVMRKCHEAAPHVANLLISEVEHVS